MLVRSVEGTIIQCSLVSIDGIILIRHNKLEVPQALASMSLADQQDNHLYMDSGATNHMVQSSGTLTNSSPFNGSDLVMVGNDNACSLEFTDEGFMVKDKTTGAVLAKGE
ncbi:hypothetical protein CQW23_16157 [Capsicum baccatum]|uniref:Uncharacterized protein n=1 Tax=Capsicum baccatum TaxID=33114 RepID=A0A2G2WAB3_CAPBA|nr:hypothetical protein CQW23_16157 [Capsicum baccatum]